jgi:hypothetical protein
MVRFINPFQYFMQYPLKKLQQFLKSRFFTNDRNALSDLTDNFTNIHTTWTAILEDAKMDICIYLADVQNAQQAIFMIHALKVALMVSEKSLHYYNKDATTQFDEDLSNKLATAYDEAIQGVQSLLEFLDDHFSEIPGIPMPEFTRKPFKNTHRVMTNLSVPQLGVFLRLLTETGIIDETNISGITGRAAQLFQTRKAAKISAESLRIKYYAPDKAAIIIMKEYLNNMLQLLRKL